MLPLFRFGKLSNYPHMPDTYIQKCKEWMLFGKCSNNGITITEWINVSVAHNARKIDTHTKKYYFFMLCRQQVEQIQGIVYSWSGSLMWRLSTPKYHGHPLKWRSCIYSISYSPASHHRTTKWQYTEHRFDISYAKSITMFSIVFASWMLCM